MRAFQACGAEFALGHHYGTFQLTDEAIDAPESALDAARIDAGIEPERFRLLKPGQVWEVEAQIDGLNLRSRIAAAPRPG